MRTYLIVVLLLLVLIPLAAFGWLGFQTSSDQRVLWDHQVRELLQQRLGDTDGLLKGVVRDRERALGKIFDELSAVEVERIGALLRDQSDRVPYVTRFFLRDTKGQLIYPDKKRALTEQEQRFLQRTHTLWTNHDVFWHTAETDKGVSRRRGWHAYYWEQGLRLIFWKQHEDGSLIGAELNRVRLLSDLVSVLPASRLDYENHTSAEVTSSNRSSRGSSPTVVSRFLIPGSAVRLYDARNHIVYQWGDYAAPEESVPIAQLALDSPLQAWSLEYHLDPDSPFLLAGNESVWGKSIGLVSLALVFVALAFFFFRENQRAMREAGQRVNFVNQVSHELKTPLTNIRMYAELLERQLLDGDPKAQKHIRVIVNESQRLSRLIENVLTFASQQRQKHSFHRSYCVLDDVVGEVLEQFRPALQRKGLDVYIDANAGRSLHVDRDVVAQILANLISNVEKYACSGSFLGVSTEQRDQMATVTVYDRGPGVAASHRDRIFNPFFRGGDKLTEGVSGTGIGLALARELAREHGGDLELVPSEQGACFRLTIQENRNLAGEGKN